MDNNEIKPPKIVLIATPAKTTRSGFNPFFHAIIKTNAQATHPPIKAATGKILANCGAVNKMTIAATLAPLETPVIPGSASGFYITDWSKIPETAKFAPTNVAKIFRGNRIL